MSSCPESSARRTPSLRSKLIVIAATIAVAWSPLACRDASAPGGGEKPGVLMFGTPLPAGANIHDVLRHPDLFERAKHVARILEASEPDELDELLKEFELAPLDQGDIEYTLFMSWWARFDPQAAFIHADNELRFDHPRTVLEVMRIWSRKDPMEAVKVATQTNLLASLAAVRTELIDILVVGWFESGNPGLEDWIAAQDKVSDAAGAGWRAYARMLILRDGVEPAMTWIQKSTLPADHKRLLWAGALTVLARNQPEVALAWLEKARQDGIDVGSFTARIARHWAYHQPRAAMEWLQSMPMDDESQRAAWHVAKRWIKVDPDAFNAWASALEPSAWSNGLRTTAFINEVERARYRVDWAAKMTAAKQFQNTTVEDGLQAWLLQRWLVVAPVDAEAWIAANPDELSKDFVLRSRSVPDDMAKIQEAIAAGAQSPVESAEPAAAATSEPG